MIQDTSAFAKFHVKYTCIVFRPFKGEVLDCIVTSVNKARLAAEHIALRPVYGHSNTTHRVSSSALCTPAARPSHGTCLPSQMGFFAEAGPLQVFVSSYVSPCSAVPKPPRAH